MNVFPLEFVESGCCARAVAYHGHRTTRGISRAHHGPLCMRTSSDLFDFLSTGYSFYKSNRSTLKGKHASAVASMQSKSQCVEKLGRVADAAVPASSPAAVAAPAVALAAPTDKVMFAFNFPKTIDV